MHPRCLRLGLIEVSTKSRPPPPGYRRIRGVYASASLKSLHQGAICYSMSSIRGVYASASLKYSDVVYEFCDEFGIRGVYASASLKSQNQFKRFQKNMIGIRGVYASASLKFRTESQQPGSLLGASEVFTPRPH